MSRKRALHLAVAIALLAVPPTPHAAAQDGTPAQHAAAAQTPGQDTAHALARWLETEAFSVSGRYDYIADARDRTLQNRMQTQEQIHGRIKVDEPGYYSVHAGLTTGNNFRSGWNSTGIGTGDGSAKIYLTQLYVAAEPWDSIELQYGSLYPARGESTEITTYDNDG